MISFAGLRRTAIFVVTVLAALALWAAPASAVAPPKVMAALGDSITRAFNSDGPGCPTGPSLDCAMNSWSTGTNPAVNSQFQRIQAIDPGRNPVAFNDSISGATARPKLNSAGQQIGLVAQAEKAATQVPNYVTIEIGANDACTGSLATQTPTADFRGYVETATSSTRSSAVTRTRSCAGAPRFSTSARRCSRTRPRTQRLTWRAGPRSANR
jgi:lysophospholipase L1-like esterase